MIKVEPKYIEHKDHMREGIKRLTFQIFKCKLTKENKLLSIIKKFVEYVTTQKWAIKPIIDDEYLLK